MLTLMGSATARASDAKLGWLPRLTSTTFGVGRHWNRADLAVFRAGIDPAARRAWHRYFRDARAADDLYAELDTGLPALLADRPLLTIFGQFNDPPRFQRRWRALNPNVHQVKVPRGNHFPMCDNPELVASALTDFAAQPDHR
jgi:pimeloyl-ACP methyl ester carboxylesterase